MPVNGIAVNAMLRAAETGDMDAVKSALANGIGVLSKDGASNTAVQPLTHDHTKYTVSSLILEHG